MTSWGVVQRFQNQNINFYQNELKPLALALLSLKILKNHTKYHACVKRLSNLKRGSAQRQSDRKVQQYYWKVQKTSLEKERYGPNRGAGLYRHDLFNFGEGTQQTPKAKNWQLLQNMLPANAFAQTLYDVVTDISILSDIVNLQNYFYFFSFLYIILRFCFQVIQLIVITNHASRAFQK